MKKFVFIMTVLLATSAFGYLGQIVASFSTVGANCGGIAVYNSSNIFVNDYSPGTIYLMGQSNGSVVSSFPAAGAGNTRGLAFDGTYLWQNKAYSAPYLTYKTAPPVGSVVASYATWSGTCHGITERSTGDYGVGTSGFYISDYSADRIYWMNTAGSLVSSFTAASATTMYEIAYDWRNGLIWGAMNSPVVVHGINTTGSIVSSFSLGISNCYGIGYGAEYLWCGTTGGVIYKVHCPLINSGLEPASLGRVKAIYR